MAAQLMAGLRYVGVSTDTKPSNLDTERWTFEEKDTGRIFQWNGAEWIEYDLTREARQYRALQPRSSLVQLYGDTFATTAASAIYLLEDVTEKGGGTSLTNNGTITFAKDSDIPLRGYNVPTLNGSSQYFSLATEAGVQTSTGSFVESIQFKTSTTSTAQTLFQYGDEAASEQNRLIEISSTGLIRAIADDGTSAATVTDTIPNRYCDGKIHTATMMLDTGLTTDTLFLFVDGELIGSSAQALGTLDNTGESLRIGAGYDGGLATYFTGQLSNYQIYKAADYNLPDILNTGIRKSAITSGDTPALSNAGSAGAGTGRLNNIFTFGGDDADYVTSVINLSEGFYDIIELYNDDTNMGILELYVDGVLQRAGVDMYAAAVAEDQKTTTRNRFFTGGQHLLELRLNDKNASSSDYDAGYQMIEFIKRDGENQGDDEATSGILFGDEIVERTNNASSLALSTLRIFNQQIVTPDAVDAYTEGDVYLKKGNYKFTITATTYTGGGNLKVSVGGTEFEWDTYDGSTTANNQKTFHVFVEGGKTPIRLTNLAKNASSSSHSCIIPCIRFELENGKGNGDEVTIWGADDDFQTVSGTAPILSLSTSDRFLDMRYNATDLSGDEIVYNRYFSGGTYKFKHNYRIGNFAGITDVLVDSDVIIDNLNQFNASSSFNNEYEGIVTISRGFHDIHIKNVGDGDSSDFSYPFTFLQFKKIATVLDADNDDNSDGVHGEQVPLAYHKARKTESTVTLSLPEYTKDDYSKFIIEISGEATAALALELKLNGLTSAYDYTTIDNDSGTGADGHTTAGTEIVLLPNTLLDAADRSFKSTVEISLEASGDHIGFHAHSSAWGEGTRYVDGHNTGTQTELNEILLETSTSTWKADTEINVYGVKK